MSEDRIARSEGRRLFGLDPAAYDAARPGHADRVYEVLVERCELGSGASVLEVGPGTGQATRRLLELGARVVGLEPDPALARYLRASLQAVEIREEALEDAGLEEQAYDLAVAASSFHWVEEASGLAAIRGALRSGGWVALWWTLFGDVERPDEFMRAVDVLFAGLPHSPSAGLDGRPPFALDAERRLAALASAGFEQPEHELVRWTATWDTEGIRALYSTFSPIRRLDDERREAFLDSVAEVAERDFGSQVTKTLQTSLYTARAPA